MAAKSSNVFFALTGTANGAVTQYRAVGFNDAQATNLGQKVKGIAHTDASDGNIFPVDRMGILLWEAGDDLSIGASLTTDNQGRAVLAFDPSQHVFADALDSAAAAGEVIRVVNAG